jgi:hypothetical protein
MQTQTGYGRDGSKSILSITHMRITQTEKAKPQLAIQKMKPQDRKRLTLYQSGRAPQEPEQSLRLIGAGPKGEETL